METPEPCFHEEMLRARLHASGSIPTTTQKIWIVGSLVNSNKKVTTKSDLDIYIQLDSEAEASEFEYKSHSETLLVELDDGRALPLELDIHSILLPGEKPAPARGRPIYRIV